MASLLIQATVLVHQTWLSPCICTELYLKIRMLFLWLTEFIADDLNFVVTFRTNSTVLGCAGFHGDCLTLTKLITARLQVCCKIIKALLSMIWAG